MSNIEKMPASFQDDYWAARRKLRRKLNHAMLWGDEKEQAEMDAFMARENETVTRTTPVKPKLQIIAGRYHMKLGLTEHQEQVQAAVDAEYDEARTVQMHTKYAPLTDGTIFVVTEITSFGMPPQIRDVGMTFQDYGYADPTK